MPKFVKFKPTTDQIVPEDNGTLAALTHAYTLGCIDAHGRYEDIDPPMENFTIDPSKILLSDTLMDYLWDKDIESATEQTKPQVMMFWVNYGPKVIADDDSYTVIVPVEYVSQHMLSTTDIPYEYLEELP